MMEAADSSESSVPPNQITPRHIPENGNLNIFRRDGLTFYFSIINLYNIYEHNEMIQ
jgi:hypothetical protein